MKVVKPSRASGSSTALVKEPFFTIARKSNFSLRAQRVLHHARQGVLHREAIAELTLVKFALAGK